MNHSLFGIEKNTALIYYMWVMHILMPNFLNSMLYKNVPKMVRICHWESEYIISFSINTSKGIISITFIYSSKILTHDKINLHWRCK